MFPEDYPTYVQAIQDLRGHIYAENYSPETAVGGAAKIIYAVSCLMNNWIYEKVEDYQLMLEYAERHNLSISQMLRLGIEMQLMNQSKQK